MIALNLDGYTDIPNGKVANIATFMEMTEKPKLRTPPENRLVLDHMTVPDVERYHALFKAVGEEWLWFSRLTASKEKLVDIISTPGFEIFAAVKDGADIGLLELDVRDPSNIELAYFGLTEKAVGTGAGRWLMNAAIERAFDHHRTKRFHVHTCTMDSPQALAFYLRSGFIPYKRSIEVADDPRLSGHIGREKGKHHPIIE